MKIKNHARAGSMESNDILIMIHPSEFGLDIQLDSKVIKQYGDRIKSVIMETLEASGISQGLIVAKDSGALDYTIRSRTKTAISRAQKEHVYE